MYGKKVSFCENENSNWNKFKNICRTNKETLIIDKEKINKNIDKLKTMYSYMS